MRVCKSSWKVLRETLSVGPVALSNGTFLLRLEPVACPLHKLGSPLRTRSKENTEKLYLFLFSFIMKTQNHLHHPRMRKSRETVQVDRPLGGHVSLGDTHINYGDNTKHSDAAHHKGSITGGDGDYWEGRRARRKCVWLRSARLRGLPRRPDPMPRPAQFSSRSFM